ncbi:hypothetical protein C8R43DRAFT_1230551 [Mycena crocata]|nr:hypothetical protein C8R43DRAFT_1230551 [Mycena crocata]
MPSQSQTRDQLNLPGIHEMFPEHLAANGGLVAGSGSHGHLSPQTMHGYDSEYSFDVLRNAHAPALSSSYIAGSSSSRDAAEWGQSPMADMGDADDGESIGAGEPKRHVCTTCGKRFNRPSSLQIHANTHTGATPFLCPHPGCGRAFNVNSNMRRHFRNHGGSAGSTPPAAPRTPAPPNPELLHAFDADVPLNDCQSSSHNSNNSRSSSNHSNSPSAASSSLHEFNSNAPASSVSASPPAPRLYLPDSDCGPSSSSHSTASLSHATATNPNHAPYYPPLPSTSYYPQQHWPHVDPSEGDYYAPYASSRNEPYVSSKNNEPYASASGRNNEYYVSPDATALPSTSRSEYIDYPADDLGVDVWTPGPARATSPSHSHDNASHGLMLPRLGAWNAQSPKAANGNQMGLGLSYSESDVRSERW